MKKKTTNNRIEIEKDIVKLFNKKKQAKELINSEYPRSDNEIAKKYKNARTGKPVTRGYIVSLRKQLLERGIIK